jgi:hypothetical protein
VDSEPNPAQTNAASQQQEKNSRETKDQWRQEAEVRLEHDQIRHEERQEREQIRREEREEREQVRHEERQERKREREKARGQQESSS